MKYKNILISIVAIVSVAFSLLVRIIDRGAYYSGWDTIGPAKGHFLISTQSFLDAFNYVFYTLRHFQHWNHAISLVYTIIPGYLVSIWPWEYWGHLITFILTISTLWLILKISNLPLRRSWILLLALGTSPALLSYSVAGYPYITGFLPHALAFIIILSSRIYKKWYFSLFFCLIIYELSWNFYELGKTVFVVFLAASILKRKVPWMTRIVWVLGAVLQLFMLNKYAGMNVSFFTNIDLLGLNEIWLKIQYLGNSFFGSERLDLPILFVLGTISFFFFKKNRWLFFISYMTQVALVVLLVFKGNDMLRPRRFLVVEFYSIMLIANMFRELKLSTLSGKTLKTALVVSLLIGNIWQISHLLQYIEKPITRRSHAMPFTYSQADYFVHSTEIGWYLEMKSRLDFGEKLFLIYNLTAFPENTTDPAAVLERLYLYLGHDRFIDSVFVFGSNSNISFVKPLETAQCRYSCVPIKPMNELESFLDDIYNEGIISPSTITFYYLQDQPPTYLNIFESDAARIFSEIRERFIVKLESPPQSKYMRFKITKKANKNQFYQGFCLEPNESKYQLLKSGKIEEKSFLWRGLPLDLTWVKNPAKNSPFILRRPWENKPFSLKLSGILNILEIGNYDFILGSKGNATITLDGEVIVDRKNKPEFGLVQYSLILERGNYPFEVEYNDSRLQAHLIVDINRADQALPSTLKPMNKSFEPVRIDSLFPEGLKGHYYKNINWTGEGKKIGDEILISESLEANWWTGPSAVSKKPWNIDYFSLRLKGNMVITKPGYYQFVLGSDDGSLLYLNGDLVIDNGTPHAYLEKDASIYLKVANYSFRLEYFDIMAHARLKFKVNRMIPKKSYNRKLCLRC